jgi:uncharacterized protein (TIGR03067 family)
MTDLDKLQGCWNIQTLEVEGSPMPAPPGARIVIEGGRFQSLGMGAVYEGTVEIDARKKPKAIDMAFTAGPEKGNRSLGIYELRGDDWKLCLTITGSQRPAKFATTAGSGCALETLKRGAAEAFEPQSEETFDAAPGSSAAASMASDPAPEIEGEWQMVVCHLDGDPVPESMVKTGRRIARDGVTTSYFGKQLLLHARYAVGRSVGSSVGSNAEPHTIDYELKGGASQYGIWKFEGEILHICFAPAGKPRPVDFTPRKGQGHTFTAWKLMAK